MLKRKYLHLTKNFRNGEKEEERTSGERTTGGCELHWEANQTYGHCSRTDRDRQRKEQEEARATVSL